jgi:ATP-dependent DNA helicase RecG
MLVERKAPMSTSRSIDPSTDFAALVNELRRLPHESEWVEFKCNNAAPDAIGEYISAIANTCALLGRSRGYVVWGVRDVDHGVEGTTFDPAATRKGNEPLESWLHRLLEPAIDFRFRIGNVEGCTIVVLEVPCATQQPVRFSGAEYIRIGSTKKKLRDFPEKERALWRSFDRVPFEKHLAMEKVASDEVLRLIDFPAYFELANKPLPTERDGILAALANEQLIVAREGGSWDITNLGGILFAKRLEDFAPLRRKSIRVVQYGGRSKTRPLKEQEGVRGYAAGFAGLITYIDGLLPATEAIERGKRTTVPRFPMPAVRELVANALIHQDLLVTGAGPMVEIFDDRIEFSNPGVPLVSPDRFIDSPPRSRNELLASLMRRFGICEERGSGIDKVVAEVEALQLPAPLFEAPEGWTRAVLFAARPLASMDRAERIRACYLHACLLYEQRSAMTNSTLRARFGIEERNRAMASRFIKEAVEAGAIVPVEPDAAPKLMRYIPAWARPTSSPRGT